MTGGPGMGGDSFTNFSTGRAGQRGSAADHEPPERLRPSQLGGIGTPALVVALLLLAAVVVVVLLL
ncbi:hypothetical protein [Actinomycetospora sp. TBRC 11914]|uniref:hypothetical protein n=1 Tax=Actinomycetospora sp. TBRC 11914 TaxID=2729387 RepID=UPI00145D4DCD|nr:hypothetical protein [Actinomycetospora sp. TBRC 11914]NMO88555.1 hypothetical protein [Actinomycetospora sp. TBRC 11914]